MLDKVKNSPHRVAITSACIIITVTIFISVFYFTIHITPWTTWCEYLLFPSIAAISGGLAAIWAGTVIVKPFLETYLERTGYGLAKRTIYFQGDEDQILRIKKDLSTSNLIKAQNYDNPHILLTDADIVILCIRKEYEIAEEDNPDFPKLSNKPKIRTSDYTEWLKTAHQQIDAITNGRLVDSQALIVFTDGWLDYKAKSLFDQRSFTTLVNTPGRIVSDIHSLLTTLPPRNDG